ncbi:MAG TPA: hypothetical protein PKM71_04345 [Candidatus Cloacimonas sp.]|nr:hypothetical protein [Candidatus Cloacimonas sp.]
MSLKIVNFGVSKTGLTTVGYTIYGVDGAVVAPRSTTGVVEIGETGVYSADITVPDYSAILLWDTGEETPKYATEDYQHLIQDIANETGRISNIYNSIKNIYEFQAALMDRLGLIQKNEGLVKVNEKLDALSKKDIPDISTIEELFNKQVGKIKFPELPKSADYSSLINSLLTGISELKLEIQKMPKSQKEYTPNFNHLSNQGVKLESLTEKLTSKIDTYAGGIKIFNQKLTEIIGLLGGVSSKLEGLNGNDKDILNSKDDITKEIKTILVFLQRLAMTQTDTSILAAFGHKR